MATKHMIYTAKWVRHNPEAVMVNNVNVVVNISIEQAPKSSLMDTIATWLNIILPIAIALGLFDLLKSAIQVLHLS